MNLVAYGRAERLKSAYRTLCTYFANVGVSVVASSVLLTTPATFADARSQAKRIHDRLAGVPATQIQLDQLTTQVEADPLQAAFAAMEHPDFFNVTLKNFAAPWTNREANVFVPLNDYTATIIGMVRDDRDFRGILSDDIVYHGANVAAAPPYSNSNNAHYEALEAQAVNLKDNLVATAQSSLNGLPAAATAGVITSRAAAKSFFIDGTNRAMFRFTLLNHMCNDMEQMQDVTRAPDRIRQDVSRSPGGDSRVFLNNCVGCHSGMDPMAQAFAYYDYSYDVENDPEGENGRVTYNASGATDPVTGSRVVAKYYNNESTFPQGFRTLDESWSNYWRAGSNAVHGWSANLPGSGSGAKSMGQELANSDTFAQCQVEKVFTNVCVRPPADNIDRAQINSMVSSFRNSGYNLKQVFAESAVYCMGE